ncbi:MAG: tRNA (guanosine(46)-N7)-methyltransferase TrmB [Bacteroidia bacterium]|nr:tRNA (guanosine(46)-N7)-methyltransferase TrmB [Bacteroidia bacterium]MDW8158477.1 tRNA (guanosine(46)-N7)-methyltransferase TrmB [Bacteroidia bacterium]
MKSKTEKKNKFPTYPCSLANNPHWKGEWATRLGTPLIVELGCGKGSFTLTYAQTFPDRFIVGIDVKSDRLYAGAKRATEWNINNVRFLRTDIFILTEIFNNNEVDGMWLTFPDPYPKKKHIRRRLTSPYYLEQYSKILKPQATVQLKTDSRSLYEYTLEMLALQPVEILAYTPNLYQSPYLNEENSILTDYETKFLAQGLNTHYIRFRFQN